MQDVLLNPYTWMILLGVFIVVFVTLSYLFNLEYSIFQRKPDAAAYVATGMAQYIGTREKQDDSFDSQKNGDITFAIVADGIGGFMDGDMASRIAVDTFMENYRNNDVSDNINYFFQSSAMSANEKIRKNSEIHLAEQRLWQLW